jgi:DNA polymerase (family 10)
MIENTQIASKFDEVADLLEAQQADPFRVRAWRRGASTVRGLEQPVAQLAEKWGLEGLQELPNIGPVLARALQQLVERGELEFLDRLRGEIDPERLLATVPGIGEVLARRIHTELEVETLEQLELAAHDGRLERLAGVGPRRAAAIRDILAVRLGRRPMSEGERPSVPLLLEIDRLYRERAAQGTLQRIAPRRFNPTGEAWLPILHVERDGWNFTAMFSNTALAHKLGHTQDWVVVYYEHDEHQAQNTVVSDRKGRRVVRGREGEGLQLDSSAA